MALPSSKTYNLTIDPDALISASGGNKQKLLQMVQADQSKLVPATIAAKKIDDIRMAAQAEQAPQQTVFQKLFNLPPLPASPGGLGAIAPQGGGMPAPQGMQMASAAPMPPQGGMPASPAGLGGMPPVGMAAGGMTELPTSYGLESLPIPDNMYNEESFAGGGIVAFAKGGSGELTLEDYMAGLSPAVEAYRGLMPTYDTSAREEFLKFYAPERLAKQKDQSVGLALFAAAAKGLASKDPTALGAIGTGLEAATPMLAEAYKTQRADELDALKARAGFSSEDYARQLKGLEGGQAAFTGYQGSLEKGRDRVAEMERAKISARATMASANRATDLQNMATANYAAGLAKATGEQRKDPVFLAELQKTSYNDAALALRNSLGLPNLNLRETDNFYERVEDIKKREMPVHYMANKEEENRWKQSQARDLIDVYKQYNKPVPPDLYRNAGLTPPESPPPNPTPAAPTAAPPPPVPQSARINKDKAVEKGKIIHLGAMKPNAR